MSKKKIKQDKKDWIVRVRETITREYSAHNCTRDEVENNFEEFVCGGGTEISSDDLEVLDIREDL